jgi:hypothetical protein
MTDNVNVRTIAGQPSWVVETTNISLAVTQLGGHLAPVSFFTDTDRPVQPYYISPWQEEHGHEIEVPALVPLRGDLFCMPFGGNNSYKGEEHTAHGETASEKWHYERLDQAGGETTVTLFMETGKDPAKKSRPGMVTKQFRLVDGHNVLYITHTLEGFTGPMSLGHHATLAVPEEEGSMRIATSPIRFGLTSSRPKDCFAGDKEYYSIAPDEEFSDLTRVPTVWKEVPYTDCTQFPARKGFMDVIGVYSDRTGKTPPDSLAWTTAAVPSKGYLWFSLKDASVLPATVFWMANGGRHMPPWSGRNRCIGLEDVCSLLADGLAPSAGRNPVNERGIPTVIELTPKNQTVINYIQGVVKIPESFDRVADIRFEEGKAVFTAAAGEKVETEVDWQFLFR